MLKWMKLLVEMRYGKTGKYKRCYRFVWEKRFLKKAGLYVRGKREVSFQVEIFGSMRWTWCRQGWMVGIGTERNWILEKEVN